MKRWPRLLAAVCVLLVAGSIFIGERNQPPVVLRKLFNDPIYRLQYQSVGSFGVLRGGWPYHQTCWYVTGLSLWEVEQRLDGELDRRGIVRHFRSPGGVEWQTKDRAYHVRIYPSILRAYPYVNGGNTIIETTEPHAFGLYERLASLFKKPSASSPPRIMTFASSRVTTGAPSVSKP